VQVGVMPKNVQRKLLTIKHFTIMKKYFVNGKQIPETEAILIDMENKRLQQSNNIADWAGIQFITII
jgi:hypothetical protein